MAVITISRTYGIGGRQFGLRLAKRLEYQYFDKELLTMLSDRLGKEVGQIRLYEEIEYGPSRSLLDMIGRKYPSIQSDLPDSSKYGTAISEILHELAEADKVVIVGRGGQAVLADHAGAVHLRLIADESRLAARLAGEELTRRCSEKEISRKMSHVNEARQKFVRAHFHVDSTDPLNYHLVLNMGRLSTDHAVDLVVHLVEKIEEG